MPRPSPTQTNSLSQPKALEMFTDRVTEQEIVAQMMAPHDEASSPSKTDFLTVFYGVGGVGKTTLCRKVVESCGEMHPNVTIANLNLDCDRWTPSSGFAQLLDELVRELDKNGIRTPLTRSLLLVYSHADAAARFTEKSNDLWSGAFGVIDEAVGAAGIPGVGLAFKSIKWLKERKQKKEVNGRLHELGLWPEEIQGDMIDIQKKLARAFFEDLKLWSVKGKNLRILLDGFERIQSRESKFDCQQLLQLMAGYLATDPVLSGRVRLLVFGRERLKWDELYNESNDPNWQTLWTQHLLEGLGESDAHDFIDKYSKWLYAKGEHETAATCLKYSPAILDAATEKESGVRRIYPYYLDLAMVIVCAAARRSEAPDLGRTPRELQERFFRYLKPEELHLLKILSLAETFDAALFDALVRDHRVAGYAVGMFPSAVVEGRTYVVEDGSKAFRFHRLKEKALQDLWLKSDAEREQGRGTCRWLIDYFGQKLCSAPRKDWGEVEIEAWRRGMELIVSQGFERNLLSIEESQEYIERNEWGGDFPVPLAMAIEFHERILKKLETNKEIMYAEIQKAKKMLAFSYRASGKIREALSLHEDIMESYIKILGGEHIETLKSMINLASSHLAIGRIDDGMKMSESAYLLIREKLGNTDLVTLSAANNLAVFYEILGRDKEAREMREMIFAERVIKLGDDHSDSLRAMSNLANSYSQTGRPLEARKMREAILASTSRIKGEEHPDTLDAMSNLAVSYGGEKRYEEALEINERLLNLSQKHLGEKHPQTLSAMNNLANSYDDLKLYDKAHELHQNVLSIRVVILGEEHLQTLDAMNNLACSHVNKRQFKKALDLFAKVFRIRSEKLGTEHPQTLAVMENLSNCFAYLGRMDESIDLSKKLNEARCSKVFVTCSNISEAKNDLSDSFWKLGAEHPETLDRAYNLAILLNREARRSEALKLLRDYAGVSDYARDYVAYNLACYECLEGDVNQAKELIAHHLMQYPSKRDQALADPDFGSIRDWIAELRLPVVSNDDEQQPIEIQNSDGDTFNQSTNTSL